MNPCPRCGAVGSMPCQTPKGAPTNRHKVREPDLIGDLERITREAVDAAPWILETDAAKVAIAIATARQGDIALRFREEQTKSATPPLFDAGPTDVKDKKGDTGFVYLASTLSLMLDALGLSPKGRHELSIEIEGKQADGVADIFARHGI